MKKLLVSIILGAVAVIFIMGEIIINLTSICIFLALASLVFYTLFVKGKDEVEILEEYKREEQDSEDILP